MKLYLSSYRIPDLQVLCDLVGKPAAEINVALIPNAKDYYVPRALAFKARQIRTALESQGLIVHIADLQKLHGAELQAELEKVDLIWVMGGNTFCIREAMKNSGFDQIIRDVLAKGVVYGGESAGTCVAGPSLKGIELADEAEFAEELMWEGLGLTPKYIVPHADNKDFGLVMQAIIDLRKDDPNLVVLNDNQAWVVNDDEGRIITGRKFGEPEDADAVTTGT